MSRKGANRRRPSPPAGARSGPPRLEPWRAIAAALTKVADGMRQLLASVKTGETPEAHRASVVKWVLAAAVVTVLGSIALVRLSPAPPSGADPSWAKAMAEVARKMLVGTQREHVRPGANGLAEDEREQLRASLQTLALESEVASSLRDAQLALLQGDRNLALRIVVERNAQRLETDELRREALRLLADTLLAQGRPAEALAKYQELVQADATDWYLQLQIANCDLGTGRAGDATRHVALAIERLEGISSGGARSDLLEMLALAYATRAIAEQLSGNLAGASRDFGAAVERYRTLLERRPPPDGDGMLEYLERRASSALAAPGGGKIGIESSGGSPPVQADAAQAQDPRRLARQAHARARAGALLEARALYEQALAQAGDDEQRRAYRSEIDLIQLRLAAKH